MQLRFFTGLSVSQTARALNRKDNAVRALQYRALRNLERAISAGQTAVAPQWT